MHKCGTSLVKYTIYCKSCTASSLGLPCVSKNSCQSFPSKIKIDVQEILWLIRPYLQAAKRCVVVEMYFYFIFLVSDGNLAAPAAESNLHPVSSSNGYKSHGAPSDKIKRWGNPLL